MSNRNSIGSVPDGDVVFIWCKFGADELPLITAVLNKLFVLVAIFLLKPPAISIILKNPIWPAILCLCRLVVVCGDCVASELCIFTIFGWGMVVLLTLVTLFEAVELEEVDIIVCLVWENVLLTDGSDDSWGDEVTIGFFSTGCIDNERAFVE